MKDADITSALTNFCVEEGVDCAESQKATASASKETGRRR